MDLTITWEKSESEKEEADLQGWPELASQSVSSHRDCRGESGGWGGEVQNYTVRRELGRHVSTQGQSHQSSHRGQANKREA